MEKSYTSYDSSSPFLYYNNKIIMSYMGLIMLKRKYKKLNKVQQTPLKNIKISVRTPFFIRPSQFWPRNKANSTISIF